MEFQQERVDEFIEFFETIKGKIRGFSGCYHLELCKDAKLDHVYYTFSRWESEEDLDNYRHSELFEEVWEKTKKMFGGQPLAYSLLQEEKSPADQNRGTKT